MSDSLVVGSRASQALQNWKSEVLSIWDSPTRLCTQAISALSTSPTDPNPSGRFP